MTGLHLQAQFSKICSYFKGQNTETTLDEMAQALCCTRRNARMVLHKMTQHGWLAWEPAVGRGKRSYLSFHQGESDLLIKRVKNAIKAGKLSCALEELNNDPPALTRLIQEQLGHSMQNGEHVFRLPYYHSLPSLNPAKPLCPYEQALVFHIFNGLTKINNNTLEPSLAHHWQAITPTHWRFYLRPCVKFHDGSHLQAQDVIWTFVSLKGSRYFSHIKHVESPEKNVVDFHLHRADLYFAHILASPMALIQSRCAKQDDTLPIGTGAFYVERNNAHQLVLKAHDLYFGFRPLIDRFEIWIFDRASRAFLSAPAFEPIQMEMQQHQNVKNLRLLNEIQQKNDATLKLEKGCYYLLLNRKSGLAKDPCWAQYLSSLLCGRALLPLLSKMDIGEYPLIHADGLLPGWMHTTSPSPLKTPAPVQTKLRLVHQAHHPLFPFIAKALEEKLKEEGIILEVEVLPFEEMMQGKDAIKTDLWLGKIELSPNENHALFSWMLCFDYFSAAISNIELEAFKEDIALWRQSDPQTKRKEGDINAKSIARALVQSQQIIPLFHAWIRSHDNSEVQELCEGDFKWK